MNLSLILSAKDRMSSVLIGGCKKSDKQFERLEKRIDNVAAGLENIGKKCFVAGSAMLAVSGMNLKASIDFEKSMSNVSTLIDTNKESIKLMGEEVLKISTRVPVAIDDLSSSLYDIRSAGISASDQFSVLEKSARLGVAGLGSTSEAVDLVTSSINAFNIKGKEQAQLYDTIFKTVKYGKTTISGIAQGFGAVAGTVAAANIKIDDYLASVAAMTTTGQPAAQAHTQMKAAIAGLTRNTKEQQKVFKALGAKDFNDLIKQSGSVVGAFSGINRVVSGNKSKLIELLGSVEAYNAVLSLTGKQNKTYTETLYAMRNGTNAVNEAFDKQANTLAGQLQRAKNIIQKISITMGNDLAPAFGKILSGAEKLLQKFDNMPPKLRQFISVGTAVAGIGLTLFGGLNFAISGVLKGCITFGKNFRMISKFLQIHRFTKEVMVLTRLGGAFKAVGAIIAGLSIPVWGIVAGIAALTAVGLAIYKYWKPIKSFFIGVGEGLKTSLKPAFDELRTALAPLQPVFNLVKEGLKSAWEWFKNLIKPVDDVGGKAHDCGVKFGEILGGIIKFGIGIVKFTIKLNPFIFGLALVHKNMSKIVNTALKAKEAINSLMAKFHKNKDVTITVKGGKGKDKLDGSHADGLDYVPFDGYRAELHKGEGVLTARENRKRLLRKQNAIAQHLQVTFAPVIHAAGQNISEIQKVIERECKKMIAQIQTEQRRMEVRAYA